MESETLPSTCYILSSKTLPSACYILSDDTLPSVVTYFSTNLVYPFTLRVTGIMFQTINLFTIEKKNKTRKNAIVEYLD